MNEDTGFLCCPNCEAPWGIDAWACPYCYNVEPPKALRASGPDWVWWLICGIVLLAAAADLSLGGHGLRFLSQWHDSLD